MHNFPAPALLLACNELCSFPPSLLTASHSNAGNALPRAFQKHSKAGGASPVSAPSSSAHPLIPSPSGGGARPGWDLSSCGLPAPHLSSSTRVFRRGKNSNNLPKSQRTFLNLPELGPRGRCLAFPNSRAPKALKHAASRSDVENASPCFNAPRDHSSPPHLILYCQALL